MPHTIHWHLPIIIIDLNLKKRLIEISLDELMAIQGALVNVKLVLTKEREIDPDKLKKIVDVAYRIVMRKLDCLEQPFHL